MICTPNTGHPVLGVHIIKLREISDYYSSVTSGRPAKLLSTDSTPASKEAERGKHRRRAYGGDGGLTHRFKRTDSRRLKPLLCKYLFHFITPLLSELHLFPDREYPRSRYCRPLSYIRLPTAANCRGAGALCSGLFCRYRSLS